MDDFFALTALRWFAPWIVSVLSLLPISKIQHFLGAQTRSYEYGRTAFSEYIEQYGRHSGRIDLLTKMVGTEESSPLTDDQISDELGSLLAGATDTTVVVATWLVWELAQRPDWQKKLRRELRDNAIDFSHGGIPSYKDIKKLPILNGFVTESMRLHPAQSIGLPRVAGTNDVNVGGVKLPVGVSLIL
jgi:cytochrome P450